MRLRLIALLLGSTLLLAACGGDDGGGATGSTPATGSSGSAQIAQFAVVVQDVEGGNTLSFAGRSCDGEGGPYDVTIALEGNLTGQTTAGFSFGDQTTTTMEWSLDATGAEGDATLSGTYQVQISPVQDSQVLVFTGPTKVEGPSGERSFNVTTENVQVNIGTGTC
jgi:hypothetical protein